MIPNAMRFFLHTLAALALLLGALIAPLAVAEPASTQKTTTPAGAARLTSDQAIAVATNDLEATADGYRLRHPRHTATFTADGLQFAPRHSGLEWAWRLTFVGAGDTPLAGVAIGPVPPTRQAQGVTYPRGGLEERYLALKGSLEQQFVLPGPLSLDGADLVIVGAVACAGAFAETADGWLWRTSESGVHLGHVRVYDARGTLLPATMAVTANATRIVVDGAALAGAAYPVTVDPEIGANDFRISFMGHDTQFDADNPAVAYNSTANQYLVVWSGDDNTGSLADNEFEIFGQLVNAATGARMGSNFRISDMGPDGDSQYGAHYPAVVYNGTAHEYLVVWWGDDDTAPLVRSEYEIFGQRLSFSGAQIGTNDFRISRMGPDGNASYSARNPAVVYNCTNNQYLVVWYGDDDAGPLVDGEDEIFGQRLDADGNPVGTNDFRISDLGPDGNTAYDAITPAVVYNSLTREYLVVWRGDDVTAPLVDGEYEVFGQRLLATGAPVGTNDFRISDMGPDGDTHYAAHAPAVVYNSTANQYLVVWLGDDNTAPLVDGEYEVFGQRLNATGTPIGTNDFRISRMGPDGNANYSAYAPAVACNSTEDEYLVVWYGDDNTGGLVDGENEIFGQRLSASGTEVGTNDFRLSDMGPDGASYAAQTPAAAYSSWVNEYVVVWSGDDDIAPLVSEEYEIFGQRLDAGGAETGTNDFRLSDMGGDTGFDAHESAVAYNSTANQYLVVWYSDHNASLLADEEFEIYGQRVDAATGALLGPNFRISDMGPDGNAAYDAYDPAVAYNSQANEYLVVWYGDDDTAPLVDGEFEIFGQRLDAGGAQVGTNDFRISDVGPDGNTGCGATNPAVAYNSTANEYLVVWSGDDTTPPLADNEWEVFGQRLDASGTQVGANDFRLSDMGPDGSASHDAYAPAVAYNSTNNEYLVVWEGDDGTAPLVDEETEIFGQRLDAGGVAVGTNDFRISDMGPDGDPAYDAYEAAVAYNSTSNDYLVVWYGDDDTALSVDEEFEIYGQRLDASGAQIGTNDFRISDMGPDGNADYEAECPAVSYNRTGNGYLVVWYGDDDIAPLVDDEYEIFGQQVSASGAVVGPNDVRLSDMGPNGNTAYGVYSPAVASSSQTNEYLVVWHGDDNTPPLVDGEYEIFGQRFAGSCWLYLPLVLRQ